jgi:hypothetical protein
MVWTWIATLHPHSPAIFHVLNRDASMTELLRKSGASVFLPGIARAKRQLCYDRKANLHLTSFIRAEESRHVERTPYTLRIR